MLNDWALPPMSTFGTKCAGHEGAGVVVKIGANVKGWKVGDRGGVKPIWDTCGSCEWCWEGKENYCQKAIHTGLLATGTYQQYITSPARYTSPIPDGVSDYVAGPIMCSASTMHRALIDSGLKVGQWVVFPGMSPVQSHSTCGLSGKILTMDRRRWWSRYPRCPTCQSNGNASNCHRRWSCETQTFHGNGR